MIRVLYSPPLENIFSRPRGQMYIKDTTVTWLRAGKAGELETVREQNLHDRSGLSVCKLAVALAEGFTKGHAKKQQAQVS